MFSLIVKTQRPMAVVCSDLLANQPPPRRGNDPRNWLALARAIGETGTFLAALNMPLQSECCDFTVNSGRF